MVDLNFNSRTALIGNNSGLNNHRHNHNSAREVVNKDWMAPSKPQQLMSNYKHCHRSWATEWNLQNFQHFFILSHSHWLWYYFCFTRSNHNRFNKQKKNKHVLPYIQHCLSPFWDLIGFWFCLKLFPYLYSLNEECSLRSSQSELRGIWYSWFQSVSKVSSKWLSGLNWPLWWRKINFFIVLLASTGDYSSLLHTRKSFIKFGLFLNRKITC